MVKTQAQSLSESPRSAKGRQTMSKMECTLIFQEKQLRRVLNAYVGYINQARPLQGIAHQIPEPRHSVPSSQNAGNQVIARPVMGGLHHDYRWVACSWATCANIQLVDEVHPARSFMAEGVFGRPLKQPLHVFRDGLLFVHQWFLL